MPNGAPPPPPPPPPPPSPAQVSLFGGEAGSFLAGWPASPAIGPSRGEGTRRLDEELSAIGFLSLAATRLDAYGEVLARRGVASWSDSSRPGSAMRGVKGGAPCRIRAHTVRQEKLSKPQ